MATVKKTTTRYKVSDETLAIGLSERMQEIPLRNGGHVQNLRYVEIGRKGRPSLSVLAFPSQVEGGRVTAAGRTPLAFARWCPLPHAGQSDADSMACNLIVTRGPKPQAVTDREQRAPSAGPAEGF